ncbi:PLP-dependent cysteine synthase family protein [Bogoriella caseilytica]|uniref:L-cysteine desulfhydrase Cds1 n=1 Tax=Bogoriella caseilytica TaxID=56055 RepID=A0A3N2BCW7_9MICO|nr:PLP-dependent cysteine synthase family protein [Bogoriella caseilytica]ROR73089.1 cysteine synthase A [Bogoriella caseilytica]
MGQRRVTERMSADRAWVSEAVRIVQADANRSADTHLRVFPLPAQWGVDLYLKDESVHPTGSLKHRLARSLILFGLVNGDIHAGTTLVEASSGSTAVSEAYFAQMLGLDFVAVVPRNTSSAKLALIEHHGGTFHLVDDPADVYVEAERLGAQQHWFFLDQFGRASDVTDWRGNNSIASSIFEQMALERHCEPAWIVVGAGTGGTSATIGRYCRYAGTATRLAVADPEGSVYAEAWRTGRTDLTGPGSAIEGIGRPRVEPSFVPSVIDRIEKVTNAESVAAMRLLADVTGARAGASTGTNLVACFRIIGEMLARGEQGSLVTLICDNGDRYLDSYYDEGWLTRQRIDPGPALESFQDFLRTGRIEGSR